jgi:hypothetical protein
LAESHEKGDQAKVDLLCKQIGHSSAENKIFLENLSLQPLHLRAIKHLIQTYERYESNFTYIKKSKALDICNLIKKKMENLKVMTL